MEVEYEFLTAFGGLTGAFYNLLLPSLLRPLDKWLPQNLFLVFFRLSLFKLEDHLVQLFVLQRSKAGLER